jgi:hypothetical protein
LSCDSRQKQQQRNHGCFKRFNIVCGCKTAAHLSILHFLEDCHRFGFKFVLFASISEAVLEKWHQPNSEQCKEKASFEYGVRMLRRPWYFQGQYF